VRSLHNLIIVVGLAVFTLLLSGCNSGFGGTVTGSGNVKTESRNVSGFQAVSLSGVGNLTIDQNGTESLTVEAEDNLLPYIQTDVQGNRLIIGSKDNTSLNPTKPINYRLTVKDLNSIDLSGAGKITGADINTPKLMVNVSGAGDITLTGKADSQDINLSGAGNYHGDNLAGKDVKITTSGAGSAVVQVSDTLDATVSGAGAVRYIGDPQVKQNVSGAGSVSKQNK
jgi:Putative auto-transporter adhesin, head GIN domain